ncbi:hypothetical protein [Mycolicibacterium hodleri]|uniref:Uncharacterized protein n=1 Tax=Mycolicibacterium hodleri TaxID=49897 RepID=A0A502E9B7_9MYCO|nr:hypothetical protein [Mycolicibacterium hodleri]TPG34223.1 hypothetical protein EAH80_11535 [Mycolicibacterium hodleri]
MADDNLSEQARLVDVKVEELAQVVELVLPNAAQFEKACAALRSAARVRADAEGAADALAADRVQFLETSLEFRDRHGTQPCPVCAEGSLDDTWAERARAALAAEQQTMGALRAARSGAHRARQALVGLVRAVDVPPPDDVGLASAARARIAHAAFSMVPVDDDTAIADHVERALPELRTAYTALRQEVADLITSSESTRRPVARELAIWLMDRHGSGRGAP